MVLTKGDCDVWVDGLKFINLFSDTYHCLKRIDNDNIHDVLGCPCFVFLG